MALPGQSKSGATRRWEAVLFDAVGTLIEPRSPIGETYSRIAAQHGVSVSPSRFSAAFRRVLPQMEAMAFPEAPPAAVPELERSWWSDLVGRTFQVADPHAKVGDFDTLFAALFDAFASANAWRERSGARAGLAALRDAGRRCAVLSNFDYRLHRILRDMGLTPCFEFVLLPGEAGAAKPDLRIFERALQQLALPADAVAHVGDDDRDDLEGARRAGIAGVDVRELATLRVLEAHLARLERDRREPHKGDG